MLPRPFVGSYGVVSNDGIPKPNFWGFKMLSQLYPERLELPDTGALDCGAFTDGKNIQILVTPQSGDYYKNEHYDLALSLDIDAESVTVQRIDDTHCNPKALWQKMGEPDNLTRAQVEDLKKKTRLTEEPLQFSNTDGKTDISISLSTNDVVLVTVKAK